MRLYWAFWAIKVRYGKVRYSHFEMLLKYLWSRKKRRFAPIRWPIYSGIGGRNTLEQVTDLSEICNRGPIPFFMYLLRLRLTL